MAANQMPDELEQYSRTYSIYSHIISLQKFMATTSQLYLGINTAIWVVILNENFLLGDGESCALLGLLSLASLWLAWLFIGITGSIRLRFILLEKIGDKYFPIIRAMGKESFKETYEEYSLLGNSSWGKARWFWLIFPGSGLFINVWLLVRLFNT